MEAFAKNYKGKRSSHSSAGIMSRAPRSKPLCVQTTDVTSAAVAQEYLFMCNMDGADKASRENENSGGQ